MRGIAYVKKIMKTNQKFKCSTRELKGIWVYSSKGIWSPSNCTLRSHR